MDNTDKNDTFVSFMKSSEGHIPLLLDGDFFQTRCTANCYGLIANNGIALLKEPVAGNGIVGWWW